jgi:hypothetical protein
MDGAAKPLAMSLAGCISTPALAATGRAPCSIALTPGDRMDGNHDKNVFVDWTESGIADELVEKTFCNAVFEAGRVTLWVIFCRATSPKARQLYPEKRSRRPRGS